MNDLRKIRYPVLFLMPEGLVFLIMSSKLKPMSAIPQQLHCTDSIESRSQNFIDAHPQDELSTSPQNFIAYDIY